MLFVESLQPVTSHFEEILNQSSMVLGHAIDGTPDIVAAAAPANLHTFDIGPNNDQTVLHINRLAAGAAMVFCNFIFSKHQGIANFSPASDDTSLATTEVASDILWRRAFAQFFNLR